MVRGTHASLLPRTPGTALGYPSPACARPGASQVVGQGRGSPVGQPGVEVPHPRSQGTLWLCSPITRSYKTMDFFAPARDDQSLPKGSCGTPEPAAGSSGAVADRTQHRGQSAAPFPLRVQLNRARKRLYPKSPTSCCRDRFPLPRHCPSPRQAQQLVYATGCSFVFFFSSFHRQYVGVLLGGRKLSNIHGILRSDAKMT